MEKLRNNNFDFLRLVGAVLVIVGHGYILQGEAAPKIFTVSVSTWGVYIFFSLSGYLIAGSFDRDPRIFEYFLKRSLRLFPALFLVVLLTVLLLGPLVTSLSASNYFSNVTAWNYFTNSVLYVRYFLPGVFETNTFPNAVNGSLWSLPAEFAAYLLVPIIGQLSLRWRAPLAILLATLCLFGSAYIESSVDWHPVFYATEVRAALSVMAFFYAGASYWYLRKKIKTSLELCLFILISYGIIFSFGDGSVQRIAIVTFVPALPYIVLVLARRELLSLPNAGRYGDFSYGLYLYSFPVQQLLVQEFGNRLHLNISVFFAFCISFFLAVLSWRFVEEPALRFKPKPKFITTEA